MIVLNDNYVVGNLYLLHIRKIKIALEIKTLPKIFFKVVKTTQVNLMMILFVANVVRRNLNHM